MKRCAYLCTALYATVSAAAPAEISALTSALLETIFIAKRLRGTGLRTSNTETSALSSPNIQFRTSIALSESTVDLLVAGRRIPGEGEMRTAKCIKRLLDVDVVWRGSPRCGHVQPQRRFHNFMGLCKGHARLQSLLVGFLLIIHRLLQGDSVIELPVLRPEIEAISAAAHLV